jgi:L-erythro-3,5-diaminohexanoate dehydrogenase
MQNPETGSGGMLVGTVEEVGPESPLGLQAGDRVATLVSLTLTPLVIEDGLERWDGKSEQVPATGTPSSSAARSPPSSPTTCPASSASR